MEKILEKEYDDINDTAFGAAIEMKKQILVVEPPKILSGQDLRGDPVLNGDLVDRIKPEQMIIRSSRLLDGIKKVLYWPTSAYWDGQKKLELATPFRSIGV